MSTSSKTNIGSASPAADDEIAKTHLDWSNKQKRILTGGGRAERLYTAERGYPYEQDEVPHYHLIKGDTHAVFDDWKQNEAPQQNVALMSSLVGAWKRLFFFGGWEHTTIREERTYNLQTRNLFIDLRIPRSRESVLPLSNDNKTSLNDLTKQELRYYARQHVFAGYTRRVSNPHDNNKDHHQDQDDLLCTRHHCIDWNFVSVPRSRPNKWYAEVNKAEYTDNDNEDASLIKTWKEWAYAKDDRGQHYYCEQWERLPQGGPTPMLALRRKKKKEEGVETNNNNHRDGLILIVGDHFNYVFARDLSDLPADKQTEYSTKYGSNTIELVDAALEQDDLVTARAYLSIQGGHGSISKGWVIDCAIEPWIEGKPFLNAKDTISIHGEDITNNDCQVIWNGDAWQVFDTTLTSVEELQALLTIKRASL